MLDIDLINNRHMFWPILYNCNLRSSDMAELTNNQCVTFCNFIMLLTSCREMTLFARGESDDNLTKHYNVGISDPQMLAQMIFNIGAKGRLCLHNENGIDPDDTSTVNFNRICEFMKLSLRYADNGYSKRAKKMKKFILANESFVHSILTDESKVVSKYENLNNAEKKDINIYYLYILHTINSHKYHKISNFVSVSEDADIAEEFARDLLFVGWVPLYSSFRFVSSQKNDYFKRLCTSKHLPYLNTPVYPEQAEISIRCGMLPHFIIGFRIENDFYVNPAIFETMNIFSNCRSFSQLKQYRTDIIKHGLKVDQSKFIEYCKMTNYKKFFTFDGQQYRDYNVN